MQIADIERNILEIYGMTADKLYGNCNGREKLLSTSVRYVFWHILHTEYKWNGKRIAETFHRKPRAIWRGLSLAKFRLQYDQLYIDIHSNLKRVEGGDLIG